MTDAASPLSISRRLFLGGACSLAASPLITPAAFAAAPGDNRLVVILLRGGMDGLDVLSPYGDPLLSQLRPTLARAADAGVGPGSPRQDRSLDGYFALHPGLDPLAPLWRAGELAAVHAVSTPYRDGRSHFDGQDVLENGAADAHGAGDGWLNRALAVIPGAPARADTRYAVAVGRRYMLMLDGKEPAASWSPATSVDLVDDERRLLERLYADDPLFAAAAEEAALIGAGAERRRGGEKPGALAAYAAEMLRGDSRIAAFSLGGWDTHLNQTKGLRRPLAALSEAILTLRDGLGPAWETTAVLAVTEFGRTARENGGRGTDHGSGGAALLAGGAIRGGRILNGPSGAQASWSGWPGLRDNDLYENRDLRPTEDVRRLAAWLLADLFDAPPSALGHEVFPGLDLLGNPGLLS